jgi:hypothetical protein
MSGYCRKCGNQHCVCDMIEAEIKKNDEIFWTIWYGFLAILFLFSNLIILYHMVK